MVDEPVDCPSYIASGFAKRLPCLRVGEAHAYQLPNLGWVNIAIAALLWCVGGLCRWVWVLAR
jgi:hypothetical protein